LKLTTYENASYTTRGYPADSRYGYRSDNGKYVDNHYVVQLHNRSGIINRRNERQFNNGQHTDQRERQYDGHVQQRSNNAKY